MLRPNLSTRPFYNERAIHVALAAVALVVLGLTAWNVVRLLSLSKHNTELSARVNRDRSEADRLMQEAMRIRRSVNNDELELVVTAAREANSLIDQRTFSWTAFFNRIESTIPPDVMLTSVRPSIKDNQTRVTMIVLARKAEDVEEFNNKLEATGAFEGPLVAQQDRTDQGLYRAIIDTTYVPGDEEPAAEGATPAATPDAATPNAPAAGAPPAATPVPPPATPPAAPPATKKGPAGKQTLATKGGRQ